MELIITEKPATALKVANFLKKDSISSKFIKNYRQTYYIVDNDKIVTSVSGHIFQRQYEKENNNWFIVDAEQIVDCPIIKILKNNWINFVLKTLPSEINVGIFTDYDNEGELIGSDILEEIVKTKTVLNVNRYTTSAMTLQNVLEAYINPTKLNNAIIQATELRHNLDLMWGASLTRFFTLTLANEKIKFKKLISVGRVQTPLLYLLFLRCKQIKEFKVENFYNVIAQISFKNCNLVFKSQNLDQLIELPKIEKIQINIQEELITLSPPTPMNISDLLSLSKIRNVKKIMDICQKLYLNGYITYPRTDSQYIPPSFKIYNNLKKLYNPEISQRIDKILEKNPSLYYRKGKIDSAHVAIIPISLLQKDSVDLDTYEVYSLILDRFLNCFEEKTIYKKIKLQFTSENLVFSSNLKIKVQEGWLKQQYDEMPDLSTYNIKKLEIKESKTKPPSRYTQNELIKIMQKRNLGTKSTRHGYFELLIKRGFIFTNLDVTTIGERLSKTLEKYMDVFLSEKFTKIMEEDLISIQNNLESASFIFGKYKELLKSLVRKLKTQIKEINEYYNEIHYT